MRKRDIGQEILESIRAIKRGEGKQYRVDFPYDPKAVRKRMNPEPSPFASFYRRLPGG